ncbi:35939_t:CDS:2, partial [Gigaspora margarita]
LKYQIHFKQKIALTLNKTGSLDYGIKEAKQQIKNIIECVLETEYKETLQQAKVAVPELSNKQNKESKFNTNQDFLVAILHVSKTQGERGAELLRSEKDLTKSLESADEPIVIISRWIKHIRDRMDCTIEEMERAEFDAAIESINTKVRIKIQKAEDIWTKDTFMDLKGW